MATVINNRGEPVNDRTYIERTDGDTAGWAIAIVLLLAVIAAAIFLWARAHTAVLPSAAGPSTNINVSSPATPSTPNTGAGGTGSTGGTGGSTGGTGASGSASGGTY